MALNARYLLDTSALSRLRHPQVLRVVRPLVDRALVATCAVLDLEALYSTRTPQEYETLLLNRHRAYENLEMDQQTWQRAMQVQGHLAAKGMVRAVGIPDLLVAATAERYGVTVLHYDRDFDHVREITGQPTQWVVLPGTVD